MIAWIKSLFTVDTLTFYTKNIGRKMLAQTRDDNYFREYEVYCIRGNNVTVRSEQTGLLYTYPAQDIKFKEWL
jgi:hypothetical protein